MTTNTATNTDRVLALTARLEAAFLEHLAARAALDAGTGTAEDAARASVRYAAANFRLAHAAKQAVAE